MDLIITTILPVVTKDLPISLSLPGPRLTYRCRFSILTTRQSMGEIHLLALSATDTINRKNKNLALTRIELTTSALAGVQVTY